VLAGAPWAVYAAASVRAVATTLILLVGLANLLPVVGALSATRLQVLYGVVLGDPNLVILMRHRAVLFGVVGGLLVASVVYVPLRTAGLVVGLISMLSFILIAWLVGNYNAELRRVVLVDILASLALLIAAILERFASSGRVAE
jgi:hypothetical protein